MMGAAAGGRDSLKLTRFRGERLARRLLAPHVAVSALLLMVSATALSVAAVLALATGVARAEPPLLVPGGQFESNGALGVAVDNSGGPFQGDVYVAGFMTFSEAAGLKAGRVNTFDPSGNLLSPPSPFVEPPLAIPGFSELLGYSGAAVNPANGDVYAVDSFSAVTNEFTPEGDTYDPGTGELLSFFPVPASGNVEAFASPTTVVGIAADSAGNVYVPVVPQNEVLKYSPTGELLKTFTGGSGSGALMKPTAVAVDSSGNLWVADVGNQRIEQLSPAGAPIGEIQIEGVVQAVAVDSHGHVFAIVRNSADFCGSFQSPCSHLIEYSSAGAQLFDFGAGLFGNGGYNHQMPNMVAVSDSSGRVYVTDPIDSRVFIFAPPTPPEVESELAVGVTISEAKLGALVNPGGIGTSYRFEYGTTTAYGHTSPVPEGDAGTGLKSRTVWASPSGLQPGTTYHYRVVVTNELGEAQGEDRTFTTETAAQAACPNDSLRTGFSAALPDCRAYELLTPPNKFSAQADKDRCGNQCLIEGTLREGNVAAPDGNRFSFRAEDVFPGSQSAGEAYLVSRSSAGWSLENEIPPQNYYVRGTCPAAGDSHSEDLSKSIFSATSGGICGLEPELISGEPRGTENIFLRDNATGAYQLINLTPPGATPADAHWAGASRDFNHVVFTEQAQLTPDALPGVEDLYEWSAGHVRLVTLLPKTETPVAGWAFVAISSDGSRVFFTAGGDLYARVNGAETLQLDASQAAGPGGGAKFLAASQDGSQVIYSDDASAALTADTVPGSGTNLYRYDSGAPAGQRLTDLTPVSHVGAPALAGLSKDGSQVIFSDDASAALTADTVPGSGTNLYRYDSAATAGERLTDLTPGSHAEVQSVISVSEDGASVYFKAEGVLASQPNQHGDTAHSGQPNLYLSHGGATTFIAIAPNEGENHAGESFGRIKVSANGAFLALESARRLTGYDNTSAGCGENACHELYLYDAATNSLACASCNPSGESPAAGGADLEGRRTRNLTENGRLFFDTAEALLPSDTNGSGGCPPAPSGNPSCLDVYEFEPAGVGTCAEPAGCVFLISTGTSTLETAFIDASANGSDVFIREFQKLVPRDTQEGAPTIYDVRVDGGFPEPALPPACVTADACRSAPAPQPSIFGEPASQTFSGTGNLTPAEAKPKAKHRSKPRKCRKGSKSKKGRCVKKRGGKARKSAHANKRTGK